MSEALRVRRDIAGRLSGLGRVAVALSGGLDSVTLLTLAAAEGLDVCAVHVDHGLRDDSVQDAEFCRGLAEQLKVPYEGVKIHIRPGNSTQGRARVQRYAALLRAAARLGGDAIATAHHRDDAVETALLQTARGGGVVAAAGPRPLGMWWGFPLVRPLLDVKRSTIEAIAAELGLSWREDPTNARTGYARNRIRHEIVPHLAGTTPDMICLREAADALERSVDELRERALIDRTPVGRLYQRDLLAAAPREVVARLLLDTARALHGELGRDTVLTVLEALGDHHTESRRFCGKRVVVEMSSGILVIEATRGQGTRSLDQRGVVPVQWDLSALAELAWFEHRFFVTEDPGRAAIVVEPGGPLTVRAPRPGDKIFVPSLRGHRMIHDVLADAQIPAPLRWRWPCFWQGSSCVWVAGLQSASTLGNHLMASSAFPGIFVRSCTFPFVHSRGRVDTRAAESISDEPERR